MKTRDELNNEFLRGYSGDLRIAVDMALTTLWHEIWDECGDWINNFASESYERILSHPQTKEDLDIVLNEYLRRKKELSLVIPLESIENSLDCLIDISWAQQPDYFKCIQDQFNVCLFMFLCCDLDDSPVPELLENLRDDISQLIKLIQVIIDKYPEYKSDIEGVELRINVAIDYLINASREKDRIKSAFKTFNLF